MADSYDLVVVGAGWYGLAAAKAYIQLHPDEKIAVLESAESCGGTWSEKRLYPGLKSNNMIGTYEYPDFPMSEEKYGVGPFSHIPAATLHRYLTDFAKHFGIFERTQFHTKVQAVEPSENGGWTLSAVKTSTAASDKTEEEQRTITTAKLILATGLTSTPNMPSYKGQEHFGEESLFHAKDFCRRAPSLANVKNVVVVGGAKSAFDVAYAMVEQGAQVDLVVRDNGNGPVWIAPIRVTPFKKRLDKLLHIRWLSWFTPCPWADQGGYGSVQRFLHGTWIGRFLVDSFWKVLGSDVISLNKYDSHPEVQKLKPWHPAFWIGSGLSILNYDKSLFDMVKQGKINVHIGNIDHLEPKTVVLTDGTHLNADAIVCATGWKKDAQFTFRGITPQGIGLPFSREEQQKLNRQADHDVLTMFPRLRDQPQLKSKPKEGEPLRLFRFIVPSAYVHKHTLAFSGAVSSVSTSICATLQGHWIAAFLDNKLDRMPATQDEVVQEIMLHTQWGKWRYPCGYGAALPDFAFEAVPYADLLLKDLGLENNRKKNMLEELTTPYCPADFAGLIEEWQAVHDADHKENGYVNGK